MVQLYFLGNEGTVDKDFSLEIGLNEYFAFLVGDWAVSRHDTQYIEFNMILFSLFGPNFSLTIFQIVE